MAIEIVDFPIKHGGSFHSKMLVHQAGYLPELNPELNNFITVEPVGTWQNRPTRWKERAPRGGSSRFLGLVATIDVDHAPISQKCGMCEHEQIWTNMNK